MFVATICSLFFQLIDKAYFSGKSIVAVDQFETIITEDHHYSTLIDCIDIKLQDRSGHLRQALSGISDNIVVCNTIQLAEQASNRQSELSAVLPHGVIWNKELIGICRQWLLADVEKPTCETHIAHSKLSYDLLNVIKYNDLALKVGWFVIFRF